MKSLFVGSILGISLVTSGAKMPCSVRPPKGAAHSVLTGLTKVSETDAKRSALDFVQAPASATADGELEVERGCLVYSFDIRVPARPGVEEVMIDAGTGKALSHKHESANQEAAEKARDKAIQPRKP